MKSQNKTISSCFDLIDTDDSGTISKEELVKALAKFNIGIPEWELKMLINPLTQDPND